MNIDKALNLAIPLPRENGQTIYVHSQPIAQLVFDQHFEIIGQTFSALFTEGYGAIAGPRIAAKLLRKIATAQDAWAGPMGVDATLMAELRRNTGVIVPGSDVPMYLMADALKRGMLTAQEADVVENALVFFMVVSAMQIGKKKSDWLGAMAGMWNAQLTSLNSTEFARSLPTSTEDASSGASLKAVS